MKIERKNMLIMALFPYSSSGHRKSLRKLMDAKGVDWYRSDISTVLHDMMGSIIRHRSTHYDECVKHVGKDKARFYVQGAISLALKDFKGVPRERTA